MYESPIQMIVNKIQTQMIQQEEDQLLLQVQKTLGFDIDKNELLRALNYDRDQYEKGYKDGRHDANWIPVSERLPEPGVEVLVTDDAGGLATISTDSIYENEATAEKEWYTSQNVTAWMPLPEPYKTLFSDGDECVDKALMPLGGW